MTNLTSADLVALDRQLCASASAAAGRRPDDPTAVLLVHPSSATNPNAAALVDFMLSPEGRKVVQSNAGSILPDIAKPLVTNDRFRQSDLEALTTEAIAEYRQARDSQIL